MLSISFIRFALIFSAAYIVAIALIYCGVQGIYLVRTIHELDPIIDKINHELDAIDTKGNQVKASITTNVTDLKRVLSKAMHILQVVAPLYRRFKTANKLKRMEQQINELLQRING